MKILLHSLGCDKNLVDAEEMMPYLVRDGHTFTDDPEEAEIFIINTCCFIGDAKKESIDAILSAASYKEAGSAKAIVVSGCLAIRYAEEIRKEIPEVDAIIGINGAGSVSDAVRRITERETGDPVVLTCEVESVKEMHASARTITTGGLYEYLRIADGCDKYCTYCVIPKVRGHYRSVPMEELVQEAESFAARGVKELILVAQETTLYGSDLYGEKSLHLLMEKLCAVEGIRWIRIMYCYPEEIYPALLDVIAREKKIVHYLDLPIQHIDDTILKHMNRRTNGEDIRRIVGEIRERIPDIVLRTTLLSGFPGETEEMHESLVRFVRETRFERLGVFSYSREEGTPAAKMKDQVKAREKKRRRNALMEAQQTVSASYGASRIGRIEEVLVEGKLPEEDVYLGRSYADAPEVDGFVFFTADREHETGELVKVRITGASEYDLEGEEI